MKSDKPICPLLSMGNNTTECRNDCAWLKKTYVYKNPSDTIPSGLRYYCGLAAIESGHPCNYYDQLCE